MSSLRSREGVSSTSSAGEKLDKADEEKEEEVSVDQQLLEEFDQGISQ